MTSQHVHGRSHSGLAQREGQWTSDDVAVVYWQPYIPCKRSLSAKQWRHSGLERYVANSYIWPVPLAKSWSFVFVTTLLGCVRDPEVFRRPASIAKRFLFQKYKQCGYNPFYFIPNLHDKHWSSPKKARYRMYFMSLEWNSCYVFVTTPPCAEANHIGAIYDSARLCLHIMITTITDNILFCICCHIVTPCNHQ